VKYIPLILLNVQLEWRRDNANIEVNSHRANNSRSSHVNYCLNGPKCSVNYIRLYEVQVTCDVDALGNVLNKSMLMHVVVF